jgi:LysR family hydrogen peroxide-inducible transcriptional activator
MKLPTVKQLRYLVALDEFRHFGQAADACHISQSGFSIAIKELEDLLNVQLIDRTNKSVTITPIGKEVIANMPKRCRYSKTVFILPIINGLNG